MRKLLQQQKETSLKCPHCGSNDTYLDLHSDDRGDFFEWVCYTCKYRWVEGGAKSR